MSFFHDQFAADVKYPDWYHWTTVKPLFQNAVVQYVPPYREDEEGSSEVEVEAFCENGNEFGDYHEHAWDFIVGNATTVEANLRRKLFVHHLKGYRGFVDQCVPGFNEGEMDEWNEIKNTIDWDTPAAIDHLYQLTSIGLLDDGIDDCGYCYFNFISGWDEEHGISILMHKSGVLAAGGISEFCNRGSELIPHVKAIQAYDLDDGDLSLLET